MDLRASRLSKFDAAPSRGQWRGWFGVVVAALLAVVVSACRSAEPAPPAVRIEVSHVVADRPLELDGSIQTMASGDELTITRLRYYLSNFRLRRADGHWIAIPSNPQTDAGYFLVDAVVPESQKFSLGKAPAGEYRGLEFMIGVDAARNHAGAQAGALDPARGMFWTWNTGYVFFKLEGRSKQSTEDGQRVTLHVGGDAQVRTVFLPLESKPVRVGSGLQPEIHLAADIATIFGGAQPLRVAETHAAMTPQDGGAIADRYAGMFRVDHVHNEPVRASAP